MGRPRQRVDAWRYPPKPSWRSGVTGFFWAIGIGALVISVIVLAIG